ncbi:minor tail protein [Mycobacterium phage Jamie19]|uniref:Minor tail protein n=1 Tax=Mycobacterium phage Jamie19 TaxID=2743929 RepID=A0AA48V5Y1_9CAUD|nr:minor tail protein [Mycobacterium phage Jamie19]QBI98035.1 minor tail protein [Mycobacterium phage SpongeBob]QKY79024.1 minor tail protein [Mycobacterium phage Jamie19]QNN98122.1 minor tail protein [Mycobacterium phage Snekmaggedon]
MSIEMPDWASNIPSAPIHQTRPGSEITRPFTAQQLHELGGQLVEQFLKQVVLALAGIFVPGKLGAAFDQLKDWADDLGDRIISDINDNAGIDLASWEAFLASLNDGKGIDLPFVTAFISGVQEFFGDIDFTVPDFDPQDAAREFVRTVVQPFLNIVSRIVPALLGPLPIGLLTDEKLTLLYEGGFDDPVTIVEGDGVEHDATDGAPGSTPLGCAKVTCDGTYKIRRTEPQPVAKDWVLKAGADVKYESVIAAAESNAVRVEIVPYMGEGNPQAAVWMASDESPAGTEPWGPLNALGSYTVPEGVTHVSVQWVVGSEATGGVVKFDNVYLQATQKIPQGFTKDLPEDLASLFNWIGTLIDSALDALGITPAGDLLDRIFDLSDELEWIQQKARDGAQDALTALGNLSTLATNLLTNPAAVIGTIPQSLVGGLETTLNQIRDVFNGLVVTPVNSVVSAIKDWFDQWFGGGSTSAIPLSQKGAANGVAPLNSSTKIATSYLETDVPNGVPKLNGSGKVPTSSLVTNTAGGVPILDGSGKVGGAQMPDLSSTYMPLGWKGAPDGVAPLNSEAVVPLANLPAEIGGEGGTGAGRPYVMLILQNNVTIPNSGITPLSGWVQTGSASVTFEDGSNTRWRFSLRGLWQIEFSVGWDGNTTGARTVGLRREVVIDYPPPTGTQQGMLEIISESRAANSLYGSNVQGLGTMHRAGTVRVSDWDYENTVANYVVHFTEDDWFDICAYQNSGSNRAVEGFGRPWAGWAQSIVTCTYLGAA